MIVLPPDPIVPPVVMVTVVEFVKAMRGNTVAGDATVVELNAVVVAAVQPRIRNSDFAVSTAVMVAVPVDVSPVSTVTVPR